MTRHEIIRIIDAIERDSHRNEWDNETFWAMVCWALARVAEIERAIQRQQNRELLQSYRWN